MDWWRTAGSGTRITYLYRGTRPRGRFVPFDPSSVQYVRARLASLIGKQPDDDVSDIVGVAIGGDQMDEGILGEAPGGHGGRIHEARMQANNAL